MAARRAEREELSGHGRHSTMVLKSMGKIGTRRGRSIVVREKILGTVEWNHFDLDPDNSPVIKVCAEDN